MDKLRALTYFIATADEKSFAGAARRLDVSAPAVHKMIAVLETAIGSTLFQRTVRGVTLTSDGQRYLEACRGAVEDLTLADELVRPEPSRLRGQVVIGATYQLAQHVIAPALPQWRARHPDLAFDLRALARVTDPEATGVEVFVLQGWPDHPDFVQRRIANTPVFVYASPGYWAGFGLPRDPSELEKHNCLMLRNPVGTAIDLWEFGRGDERRSVAVSGWLVSNHRDVLLDAALAGEGVGRFVPLSLGDHVRAGRLVPALLDWRMLASAPIDLLYRPEYRRTPRVRATIEFLTQLFAKAASADDFSSGRLAADKPSWYRLRYARASAAIKHR